MLLILSRKKLSLRGLSELYISFGSVSPDNKDSDKNLSRDSLCGQLTKVEYVREWGQWDRSGTFFIKVPANVIAMDHEDLFPLESPEKPL